MSLDPMAELQHKIREAAHDVGALCGYLNSVRLIYARGDRGEVNEMLLLELEYSEERARFLSYALGNRKHEAGAAIAAMSVLRRRMKELKTNRSCDHDYNPDDPAPYARCIHCGERRT
jgi:hypothetical protein